MLEQIVDQHFAVKQTEADRHQISLRVLRYLQNTVSVDRGG